MSKSKVKEGQGGGEGARQVGQGGGVGISQERFREVESRQE